MNSYGYIRVSTDQQGLSVTAQQERIESYCRFKNLNLDKCFIDEDVSGKTPFSRRKGGGELLAHVRPGDAIVTVKLDRTFRDTVDGLTSIFQWSDKGISLHISDGDMIADTSTSNGFMMVVMQLAIAQIERMKAGERTSSVLQSKKARGERVGRKDRIPFGLALDPVNDKLLIPCRDEQSAIAVMARLRSEGMHSNQEIANAMNRSSIPNRGKPWTRHSVKCALNNVKDLMPA